MTDVDCDDIARACIVKYMREGNPGEAVAVSYTHLPRCRSTAEITMEPVEVRVVIERHRLQVAWPVTIILQDYQMCIRDSPKFEKQKG